MAGLLDRVRELWRVLTPESHEAEPVVTVVDDWRTEFTWRGPTLTVDRRRKAVMRGGRVLVQLAQIRSVDVVHVRADDDRPEHWKVSLSTGFFAGVALGTTRIDVDASIAAARLATVLDMPVRSP